MQNDSNKSPCSNLFHFILSFQLLTFLVYFLSFFFLHDGDDEDDDDVQFDFDILNCVVVVTALVIPDFNKLLLHKTLSSFS